MTPTSSVAITPTAIVLHQRVLDGYRYMEHPDRRFGQVLKGQQRLVALLTDEYVPALRGLLDEYGRGELAAYRDHVQTRIEAGWPMLSGEPPQEWVEGWEQLLHEYEVVCDALELDATYLRYQMDRIGRLVEWQRGRQ